MFTLLRFKIALFFAAFTFALLVLQSITMMYLEFRSSIHQIDGMLAEDAQRIVFAMERPERFSEAEINYIDKNRLRLFDANGELQYVGIIFRSTSHILQDAPWFLRYRERTFRILTFPMLSNGEIIGYLQIGESIRTFTERLNQSGLMIIFLSILFSSIMFIIGMQLERRAMKPAQEALENMRQFAQNAGHELRTPLANMQSSIDVALQHSEYKKGFIECKSHLNIMSNLIDRLLQLETLNKESLHLIPLNISLLGLDLAQKFTSVFSKNQITFVTDIHKDVIRMADEALIRTAITNLLHNAKKFTPPKGTITLRITHRAIEVRDTGIGMDHEVSEHIFERFFKADTAHTGHGFGLGLALVKRIVDVHEWKIDVRSAPGNGTRFFIYFRK